MLQYQLSPQILSQKSSQTFGCSCFVPKVREKLTAEDYLLPPSKERNLCPLLSHWLLLPLLQQLRWECSKCKNACLHFLFKVPAMLDKEAYLGSKLFQLCNNSAESNTAVSFSITVISTNHSTDCKICYKTNCHGQNI